ncbi:MAG: SHOCT domain-containing protein [Nitrospirota bacterium]|nr:SHOCT domain-containing protein [Nitrospirota bacterium]
MHWGDYGWGIGFGLGWFFMVIFWILVILGIIYFVKLIVGIGAGKGGTKDETLSDIIKKRYAKGEITKEEFEKLKDDLTKE